MYEANSDKETAGVAVGWEVITTTTGGTVVVTVTTLSTVLVDWSSVVSRASAALVGEGYTAISLSFEPTNENNSPVTTGVGVVRTSLEASRATTGVGVAWFIISKIVWVTVMVKGASCRAAWILNGIACAREAPTSMRRGMSMMKTDEAKTNCLLR